MSGFRIALVAVATRSHLGQAAVLAETLERVHPGVSRTLFLVEPEIRETDTGCGWNVCAAETLKVPDCPRFFFQYKPFQLCCALKPYAMDAVLDDSAVEGAVYLDTDLYAVAPFLDVVWNTWQREDVGLTPHLKTAQTDHRLARFLRYGSYNAGFLAVRNRPNGRAFLRWFQKCVERECVRDVRKGLFDDQRWLDLAAAVCAGVVPIRDAGLNVGPWNKRELRFERRGEAIWVNGEEPLRLLHLTSRDHPFFESSEASSKSVSIFEPLLAQYHVALERAEARFPPSERYGYGTYRDGTPIGPAEREAVRQGVVQAADPFAVPEQVKTAARQVSMPVDWREENIAVDQLLRLRAHPIIGRVWRFWKCWINHDLP